MKVTGNKSLSSFIKLFLQIILVIGSTIYVLLPILLKAYIHYINPELNYIFALILLTAPEGRDLRAVRRGAGGVAGGSGLPETRLRRAADSDWLL